MTIQDTSRFSRGLCRSAILALGVFCLALATLAQEKSPPQPVVKHVLLLSLDGMHAVDVANFVKMRPDSALASLTAHAITYTDAQTSLPSNSWPGLLAMVTGGSPFSTGVIFENSYARSLSPP